MSKRRGTNASSVAHRRFIRRNIITVNALVASTIMDASPAGMTVHDTDKVVNQGFDIMQSAVFGRWHRSGWSALYGPDAYVQALTNDAKRLTFPQF